jgi:type II secretory pathway pseudopilin PulG
MMRLRLPINNAAYRRADSSLLTEGAAGVTKDTSHEGCRRCRDEKGVTLVLVLVFLFAIGLVLVALASAASGNLLNSSNLRSQRSVEYAASSAATMALQNVRYSGNPYSTTAPANCLPTNEPVTINNVSMQVQCTQAQYNPASGVTRVINFYACHTGTCSASNALLEAQVTFDDYSVANAYSCTYLGSTSTCGTAMTVNSWILETANN